VFTGQFVANKILPTFWPTKSFIGDTSPALTFVGRYVIGFRRRQSGRCEQRIRHPTLASGKVAHRA